MRNVQVTAYLKLADGTRRVEDLGTHEATTGERARRRAVAMHSGRLGWRANRRPRGWYFRVTSVSAVADETRLGLLCSACSPRVPCLNHVTAVSDRMLNTPEALASELASVQSDVDMAGPDDDHAFGNERHPEERTWGLEHMTGRK